MGGDSVVGCAPYRHLGSGRCPTSLCVHIRGQSSAYGARTRTVVILNRRRLPCGECLPNVASDDVAVYARALRAGIDSSAARSKSARWLSSGQKTTNSVTPMSRKADTILSNASGVAQASSAS